MNVIAFARRGEEAGAVRGCKLKGATFTRGGGGLKKPASGRGGERGEERRISEKNPTGARLTKIRT